MYEKETADSIKSIANAITPFDASPGRDTFGGTVASLTEAVMGIPQGLQAIADSISKLADILEEKEF